MENRNNSREGRMGFFSGAGFLLAVALVVSMLSAPVEAMAADGYSNTVKAMRSLVVGAKKRGDYVKYFCGTDVLDGNTAFEQISRSKMSPYFTERNPGSQINCLTYSGTWADGPATFYLESGRVYKQTFVGDQGLTYEYDLPAKSASTLIVRISDSQGSNIVISVDMANPSNSQYIEARLPINMQSSGIVTGDKGYQYASDELVVAMNREYKDLLYLPNSTLIAYANQLLLSRAEREILIKDARRFLGKSRKRHSDAAGVEGASETAVGGDTEPR